MAMLEELKELGVNVEEGKNRLMNNTSLYERMLGKAVAMLESAPAPEEYDTDDWAELTERTHAIKGVTGNLSLTPLYSAYSEIVRLLRANEPQEAKKVMCRIVPVQQEIVGCIRRHTGT